MLGMIWIQGLLQRRRVRVAGAVVGIATAVALLASIGAFLSASKATMTARATRRVPVAWQVEVQRGADPATVQQMLVKSGGIDHAVPVLIGKTTGFGSNTGGTIQTTGPGVVVGLPDAYRAAFPDEVRDLLGAARGVLLTQQTAANLHAAVGDTVTIGRDGLADAGVVVAGIVDLPFADSFFQSVGVSATSQPTAPPDNVVIVPDATWHAVFDPLAASRPDLVVTQIHASYDRPLPTDPAVAYSRVVADAHNLELALAGTGLVGDNLAAALGSARSDALYAQILFLFLGVPGAVLAALLTITVVASGADRRRRDQALLRARGASTRQLVRIAGAEAAVVAAGGGLLGLVGAVAIGRAAFGTATFGATTVTAIAWIAGAVIVGLAIALVSIVWPAWRDARDVTVASSRRVIGRIADPRWLRWGVDLVALAASLAAFWLTSRNGYKLVLAVEGVPRISVNYWAFAAPALLWLAAGLLTWRVANAVLRRGRRPLARLVRPIAGPLSDTVAATMSRQRRLLARGLALVALTVAFAASTSVFNATYQRQAEIDAVLSNGADVTVVEPPGVVVHPDQAAALASIAGVRRVTALQHRFAYVGNDLQDLYGIDATTIVGATKLQDAYFAGGTARQLMARLAARPDAVLVSAETARDYRLTPGDTIHLRLQDGRSKQYTDVPFTYTGIVKEFPTAPSDSFIVANAGYITAQTGSDTIGAFLLDTNHGDSTAVAQRVQTHVGTGASVNDIVTKRRTIRSSLTAVELAGLTRVELGFALVLSVAATGLVLWLGLDERRRTFAIAATLGANRRQLAAFVRSEAVFVTAGGLLLGSVAGWALTNMVVKVLTGVFDPAPASLAYPWTYLLVVVGVALAAVAIASQRAIRAARRPAIEILRDL